MTILVLGNCQATPMTQCLRIMLPGTAVHQQNIHLSSIEKLSEALEKADVVLTQPLVSDSLVELVGSTNKPIYLYPRISFTALQPDYVRVESDVGPVQSPLGNANSSIAFFGWINKLGVEQTVELYSEETFATLKYFDLLSASTAVMEDEGRLVGLDLIPLVNKWLARGPFLYTINHPKLFAMADVARLVCRTMGIEPAIPNPEDYIPDPTLSGPVWPVYPEIARRFGFCGSRAFKMPDNIPAGARGKIISLSEFVALSFAAYDAVKERKLFCPTVHSPRFRALLEDVNAQIIIAKPEKVHSGAKSNPYKGLPDHQYWRRAVSKVEPQHLDPVVSPRFGIEKSDLISTAGSCFAQHIARNLAASGYNYYVSEMAPKDLDQIEALRQNYGVYSARYGNIYTARQLLQLLHRALGVVEPLVRIWTRPDGAFVDPFRPEIIPEGFASERELDLSRQIHLAAVREILLKSDIFVYTLGLTEAWESKLDGSIVPLAPGVVGSPSDNETYRFRNFTVEETKADLREAFNLMREIRPNLKILLTVSPVPLIATYEKQHILTATTYSKSVLRVAASALREEFSFVDYFPSYEIITSQSNRGRYYEEDLRGVKPEGVSHVMRIFFRHYCNRDDAAEGLKEALAARDLVCEEERLGE